MPVHTAGDTNGLPFYTMPFVEGDSLRARLGHGPLPVGEVIGILRDVAKALAYAHQRGVVHRDLKPDNVLISGGVAVVTDFGIAKAISASRGHWWRWAIEDGSRLGERGRDRERHEYEQQARARHARDRDVFRRSVWSVMNSRIETGCGGLQHYRSVGASAKDWETVAAGEYYIPSG